MKEKKISSKMSEEERVRRRLALGRAASEQLAKGEQINFRIEEKYIRELQDLPARNGRPLGTMIREWVLERLAQEKLADVDGTGRALRVLDETYSKLKDIFENSAPSVIAESSPYTESRKKQSRRKTSNPPSRRKAN